MEKRDKKGQFAEGGKGGPGRPSVNAEVTLALSKIGIVIDTVSNEDWKAIVTKAVEQAKNGDSTARTWLCSMLVADSISQILEWKKEASFTLMDALAEARGAKGYMIDDDDDDDD